MIPQDQKIRYNVECLFQLESNISDENHDIKQDQVSSACLTQFTNQRQLPNSRVLETKLLQQNNHGTHTKNLDI